MALALLEAGARAVYCVDLPKTPGEEWTRVRDYAARLEGLPSEGRLEYFSADVRDQEAMWKLGETIGNREGRMDACVAAAGVLKTHTDCLRYPAKQFQEVSQTNARRALCAPVGTLPERSMLLLRMLHFSSLLTLAARTERRVVEWTSGCHRYPIHSLLANSQISSHHVHSSSVWTDH